MDIEPLLDILNQWFERRKQPFIFKIKTFLSSLELQGDNKLYAIPSTYTKEKLASSLL